MMMFRKTGVGSAVNGNCPLTLQQKRELHPM